MFAGKTARLITLLREAQEGGERVVALKHHFDNRYDAVHLSTHDGHRFAAQTVSNAAEFADRSADGEVIGLDETHFFGRALIPVVRDLLDEGRRLILVGLENDAWGQPFVPMPQLMEMVDAVEIMTAPCTVCGQPARYTQRMVPVDTPTMVGGRAEYEPRCKACFQPLSTPAPEY